MAEEQKDISYPTSNPNQRSLKGELESLSLPPEPVLSTHLTQIIPPLPTILTLPTVDPSLNSHIVSNLQISLVRVRKSRDLSSRFVTENERSLKNERSVASVEVVVH